MKKYKTYNAEFDEQVNASVNKFFDEMRKKFNARDEETITKSIIKELGKRININYFDYDDENDQYDSEEEEAIVI